jgi:hypothetical protein
MKIKPKDTNIKTIFESSFLTIPRFQRPYSWDEENVVDFWNDVVLSKDEDYFIGSMVFFRASEASGEAFVVDGQQRLLTITILFAAIRDIFVKMSEEKLADGLQRIIERRDIDNDLRFTLVSEDPYPFFQHHIQTKGTRSLRGEIGEEERNIKGTYDQLHTRIEEHVDGMSKAKAIKALQTIRDRVLSVKVITIDLDNEDDAYLIFETLNTRGKDLTVSDLVKNHLARLIRAGNSQSDLVREKWRQIHQTIGRSLSDIDIDSFVVHHWISKYEYLPERRLFKSLRATISKKASANDYLNELYAESSLYRGIFEPSFLKLTKQENEIHRALRAIALFRLRQAAPFVLALLSAYHSKQMSLSNTSSYLRAIENFHFKFTAVTSQRGAGGVAAMYSRAARSLRAATTQQEKRDVCQELCGRFDSMQPEETEFIVGWHQILYSRIYQNQRPLVRYILEKIHRRFNDGGPFDYMNMTVEHLLSEDNTTVAEEVKASLGNLLFVSEELNKKLKNKAFKEKKKILVDAGIRLDPVLENATSWNDDEIDDRTENLGELAYNDIWRVPR